MRLKTTQLTIDALLAAMCAVLGGLLKIDLRVIKITLESFPVLMAAFMFGPLDGALVGGIGTFIYQMLAYPLSATTPLWILPYVITGALAGAYAKKHHFQNTPEQIRLCIAFSELLLLVLNTAVIYTDAKIYGYYSFAYVFGAVWTRLAISCVKVVLYSVFTHALLVKMSYYTRNGRSGGRI